MDYLPLITKDEQKIICDMIGGAFFKKCFVSCPNRFNDIKPGCRATKLSEEMALNIAKSALKHPFIQDKIYSWLKITMQEIQSYCKEKEAEGRPHLEALAVTLIDSYFSAYPELYCKLSGEELSDEQVQQIIHEMKRQNSLRKEETVVQAKVMALNQEIENLQEQLQTEQEAYEKRRRERDKIIAEQVQIITALKQEIAAAQKQIEYLKSKDQLTKTEIDDKTQLLQYMDASPAGLPEIGAEGYVSLCEVEPDYNNQKRMHRYADIDHNGILSIFHPNHSRPFLFENRDNLYRKDGPDEVGTIGVWSWTAKESYIDPSKDFIDASFQKDIRPIEIIRVSNCRSVEQLIDTLKEGYTCTPRCSRIMFTAHIAKGAYTGVLCSERHLILKDGIVTIADTVDQLPVYDFSSDNIIKLKNNIKLYHCVYAGVPKSLYRVKNITDIVRSVLLGSLSWKNYMQHCAVKAEYQKFKELLRTLSTQSNVEKIMSACHCTEKAAEDLLNNFISNAAQYISADGLEDAVLHSLIDSDKEMTNRIKSLIQNEWKQEQAALLSDAQRKLDTVNAAVTEANRTLTAAKDEYDRIKDQEITIQTSIAEKQQLAANVEKIVEERIQSARENAAEFIADMAFTGVSAGSAAIEHTPSASYNVIYPNDEKNNIEILANWDDAFQTVCENIENAGVVSEHTRCVAAYLCAAYILKQPLLIVGPNSDDIINAFKSALFGGKYGCLHCAGTFNTDTLYTIGKDGEQIVKITDMLSVECMNYLPEITANRKIFFISAHPFPEDIQVEPKSLYNYVLPLFTELFVERTPFECYTYGCFDENFVTIQTP